MANDLEFAMPIPLRTDFDAALVRAATKVLSRSSFVKKSPV